MVFKQNVDVEVGIMSGAVDEHLLGGLVGQLGISEAPGPEEVGTEGESF